MKKWCIALTIALALATVPGAFAQEDDFDWDSLMSDTAESVESATDAAAADADAAFADGADALADFADETADASADFADDFAGAADEVADAADDFGAGFDEAIDDGAAAVADDFAAPADDFAAPADDFAFADEAADDAGAAAADFGAADDDVFSLGFDDGAAAAPDFDEAPAEEPVEDDVFADEGGFDSWGGDEAADEPAEPVAPVKKPGSRYAERLPAAEAQRQARSVDEKERVRRQADEDTAKGLAAEGIALRQEKPYQAEEKLQKALDLLPSRPETEADRELWTAALADAKMYRAQGMLESPNPDLDTVGDLISSGLELAPNHRGLLALQKKYDKAVVIASRPVPPAKRPETIEQKMDIRALYVEARQWYALGDYDQAARLFQQILQIDPYHKSAIRYLQRIEKDRYNSATREREYHRAGMLTEVRKKWNPPMRSVTDVPRQTAERDTQTLRPASHAVVEKMQSIRIPKLEFRQANIADVVTYLVNTSIEQDPEGEGINIILNLGDGGAVGSAPVSTASSDDDWGFDDDGFDAAPASGGSSSVPPITLNLRNVSIQDAINYITEVASLKYRVENTAVIITSKDAPIGNIITRMYPVQPSFMDVVIQRQEMTAEDHEREFVGLGANVSMSRGDVKEFFEQTGVQFPTGASITYNSAISKLIVANTAENLETFERILAQLDVIPNQVEIEARFIEVNQDDLEELGLRWSLNDNWEIATKRDGSGGRIQMNAGNLSNGLRSMGYNSSSGNIEPVNTLIKTSTQTILSPLATFSSVLTNPELSVVIDALSQHGGSDLLSAPRVTTRSGVNAQIQVVREIIYPTEFDLTQPTVDSDGNVTMAPIVTPGSFETRATGVILNVTPTVGADGYTIDLLMAPEVAELVDWIQYGSVIEVAGTPYEFNMPMPVFTSRNVATSLVIWDGQTVVMGGLIREEVSTIKDKVPILGDIPLLGWFFRSESSYSQKKNLLIFVTARLVDPAGRPVHGENALLPGGGLDTAMAEE